MALSVWAPRAKRVEVVRGDERTIELQRKERGYFSVDVALEEGARYAFRVDGQGPFPDPRSRYQPEGVHGPSEYRRLDFSFSQPDFCAKPLDEAVIYELHVGTFSEEGTFLGAIGHLDALQSLGVTHLEIMPVAAFPGHHGWGYDGVALFAPHAPYGTPEDLARLVDEAHARRMAVLLDVVFNHLGPDGNYLGIYGPYFTDRYRTPWGEAVNLDGADSDLVRKAWIDCALHWLGTYRFDGLRLDAVHALYDQSAVHFLEELSDAVSELERASQRSLVLIAECDLNDPRYVRPKSAGGLGMDAHWCDDYHHALHTYFTGERDGYYQDYGPLRDVEKALRQGYVFDGTFSPHRRRQHGRSPNEVQNHQLVVCIQNHDQIGNRARGDRLTTLVSRSAVMQMAALNLLGPFVPLLFQGEEWGTERPFLYFTDHQDRELARNVTEGRRQEFGYFSSYGGEVPDPQAASTFEQSKLDFGERDAPAHVEVLAFYQRLIALRREFDLGKDPVVEVRCSEEEGYFVLERGGLAVYLNLGDTAQSIPNYPASAEVLAQFPSDLPEGAGELPPGATVVVRKS